MKARERFFVSLCVALALALFVGGKNLPTVDAKSTENTDLYDELKTFTDVLSIIRRDYVTEVENKTLVEGAIKGMLSALDPHSGYLDPDFYKDLQVQTKGEFGGLGIEITIKDGLLVVVAPMEGSPAEKAGIQPGDAIVKIEGKFTKEFSLVDAVKRLRGPKGSPITISVHRKNRQKLIDVTIIRDNITVASVKSRYLGDGYGYVRISQFMERTADDLKDALQALVKASGEPQLKGLVLDVRNNPGGLLTQAIRVSDMFLTEGVVVYTEGRVVTQKQEFFAHARGTEPAYPIIVLVNGGSASASEIVAGAFKDHGRALILGTQTFGKGSVQTITPLENGGALTLTTALYYTKNGNSLQAKGVTPDIELPLKAESKEERKERKLMREQDLPGAISNPDGNEALRKINKTPKQDT
ncbi:MAG: S41 family peptidase, partial [Bdellovibrionales bacterium]|nr:S41 family peptidase [Bdellovibrionales bacterium]